MTWHCDGGGGGRAGEPDARRRSCGPRHLEPHQRIGGGLQGEEPARAIHSPHPFRATSRYAKPGHLSERARDARSAPVRLVQTGRCGDRGSVGVCSSPRRGWSLRPSVNATAHEFEIGFAQHREQLARVHRESEFGRPVALRGCVAWEGASADMARSGTHLHVAPAITARRRSGAPRVDGRYFPVAVSVFCRTAWPSSSAYGEC